ncbi:MAG: D-lyxose/D-mannose family sugar isomerase [Clostridiales bacterium]|nr:D-lyxose/D-mannose family sugar isomerase [Clostridiales bacterium]
MKRSEINAAIKATEDFIKSFKFALPPFVAWTPKEWHNKGEECVEIRDNMLGWDVTDFGLGSFAQTGLTLITLRNGNQHDPKYPKVYAEKLMVMSDGQACPMHFHWQKTEDIINRGGGTLMMELWNSAPDGSLDRGSPVRVSQDGVALTLAPGMVLTLMPGESVTVTKGIYHSFWAQGRVMIGEVSERNDDNADNRFLHPLARFPSIDEDEPPYRLLCGEYPSARD